MIVGVETEALVFSGWISIWLWVKTNGTIARVPECHPLQIAFNGKQENQNPLTYIGRGPVFQSWHPCLLDPPPKKRRPREMMSRQFAQTRGVWQKESLQLLVPTPQNKPKTSHPCGCGSKFNHQELERRCWFLPLPRACAILGLPY